MVAKFKKIKKGSSSQNIFFSILIGLLFLFVIGFLFFTNLKMNRRRTQLISRIEGLKEEIRVTEARNEELREGISQAGSEDYLEKIAREQLGFKAPGEEVAVVARENEEQGPEIAKEEKGLWNPQAWWEWIKNKVRD